MPHFVTHLESAIDGTQFPSDSVQTLHAGRPLWVRYDLDAVKTNMTKSDVFSRKPTMWRYRELLPIGTDPIEVSLGEGMSPLLSCPELGKQLGLAQLSIKDESQLPTGSFKSRGLSMAITMAKKLGINRVAIPTAGNAGGAMAAYAARAGLESFVFMPEDTPVVNQYEADFFGAKTFRVNGLINDCGKLIREGATEMNWFDLSTLKEPYRIEGKKTMGLELAEQFGWKLPDVILYPTGGGTGLIGMWKAFNELRKMGWLDSATMPRMVSVQSDGCSPISDAFDRGERFAQPHVNAVTKASGLRVPVAVGDFMILDAIRESNGRALSVDETRISDWTRQACSKEGISLCPEAGACVGALQQLREEKWIDENENVVIFNTGALQKYVEVMTSNLITIDLDRPVDWSRLGSTD
ncbi:MAG: threonine synthase [Pirellulaceae bacterium]|jgi:threonine synthase|nr:threonine synthase [Pirellulaceae bacterium]